MKKILAFALACVMSLSMAACSSSAPAASAGSSSAGGSASGDSAFSFDSPITVVVPFKAGSATDNQIRLMQSKLEKALGTNLVIVNAEGGSGTIGTTEYLSNYAADGYTILYTLATPVVYKPLGGDTAYTYDDLTSVARTSSQPMYLIVPDSETRSAQEILDYIKENPGKFTYANVGNGGNGHLAFASFLVGEGLDAVSVPYSGGTADCYTAMMGGEVNAAVYGEADLLAREDNHAVINLGSKSTVESLQDVPTLADLAMRAMRPTTWPVSSTTRMYPLRLSPPLRMPWSPCSPTLSLSLRPPPPVSSPASAPALIWTSRPRPLSKRPCPCWSPWAELYHLLSLRTAGRK